jgi:tetratricopeptide (TPR) repeat protein
MTATRIDELRAKFEDNPRRYFAPLANEYRKAGDLTSAIELCREFLPNQPGHMSGHIVYGQALFESGDLDEARTVFETALELDPENLIALRHLGDIARIRQDLSVAKRWYERVLEADPRNDDIAAQLVALAAQRRTPISVAAIVEPPALLEAPTPAPLLDDELMADVANMHAIDTSIAEPALGSIEPEGFPGHEPVVSSDESAGSSEHEMEFFVSTSSDSIAPSWDATPVSAPTPWPDAQSEAVDVLAVFASTADDIDDASDGGDLAMTAESERDVALEDPLPFVAEAAEPSEATVASATALTEALDAFATWDVRDSVTPTAADRAALETAWAEVESDDAALADAWSAVDASAAAELPEASIVGDSSFEAGFFVPEWPNDLEAVGPRAATDDDSAADADVHTPDTQPEELPVAPRAMTDPWVSIVAASEAAPDHAPIVAAATPSVSTVEAVTAAASAEPSPPRLAGLETIDDAMAITGDEALAAAAATPIDVVPEEDQRVVSLATLEHDEPIITETVAELYLQQGLNDRALAVYRALGVRRPDDHALHDRIAMLEAELAPRRARSAREWLAALASRQVTRRVQTDPRGGRAVRVPTPSAGLGELFASKPAAGDERAAQRWSDAFGSQAVADASTDLFDGLPTNVDRASTPAVSASRVTPVATAAVNGGFSFDQFFDAPDATAPASDREGQDPAAAAPPAEDLAQFAAWLRGLAG